jgi:hypothetical protein
MVLTNQLSFDKFDVGIESKSVTPEFFKIMQRASKSVEIQGSPKIRKKDSPKHKENVDEKSEEAGSMDGYNSEEGPPGFFFGYGRSQIDH